ncbi:hypothetical protein V8F06_004250 [Rhypophila decipiens]
MYSPYSHDLEYPWLRENTRHMFDFFRLQQNIAFPQFSRLPIELRHYVWEFFCPALAARSRVYEFIYWPGKVSSFGGRETAEFRITENLKAQTRELRIVMAVHRESRYFAQRRLPDTLQFGPRQGYELPFNKVNDVIFIHTGACAGLSVDAENPCELLEGVSDQIHNLAFDYDLFSDYRPPLTEILCAFPNLQRTFVYMEHSGIDIRELKWCVSDMANFCQWEVENNSVYGKDYMRRHWAWPDLTTQRGREYASTQVPLYTIAISGDGDRYEMWRQVYLNNNYLKVARDAGMDIWPMVEFTPWDDQDALERLREYASAGHIEGEDYDQDDWDRLHGWAGYLTVSETSGDGFDPRDDEESSTDDEPQHKATTNRPGGSDDDDELENSEPWFYNSVGEKVPEFAIAPWSIIHYKTRCPALHVPSETEDKGDEGDVEDEVD